MHFLHFYDRSNFSKRIYDLLNQKLPFGLFIHSSVLFRLDAWKRCHLLLGLRYCWCSRMRWRFPLLRRIREGLSNHGWPVGVSPWISAPWQYTIFVREQSCHLSGTLQARNHEKLPLLLGLHLFLWCQTNLHFKRQHLADDRVVDQLIISWFGPCLRLSTTHLSRQIVQRLGRDAARDEGMSQVFEFPW